MRGDEENVGVQFNLYIIDLGKGKELGPKTAYIAFLITLYLGLWYIRVLSGKNTFESHPMASLYNCTLSEEHTLISSLKRSIFNHCQVQKPVIYITKLETGTRPFYQAAVFTEIADIFLYSK